LPLDCRDVKFDSSQHSFLLYAFYIDDEQAKTLRAEQKKIERRENESAAAAPFCCARRLLKGKFACENNGAGLFCVSPG
jgi:hypothetical protein